MRIFLKLDGIEVAFPPILEVSGHRGGKSDIN